MDKKKDKNGRKEETGEERLRVCVGSGGRLYVYYREWEGKEGRVVHSTICKAILEGRLCFLTWLSGEGQSRGEKNTCISL